MKDRPAPAAPSDGSPPTRVPTPIEEMLTAYVLAAESGGAPALQDYLSQLDSVAEREQFVDLVDHLAFLDRHLPLRLRARIVLGGRYELLESIGIGGMGQVWRALDKKLGHEVAVKVLNLAASAALDLDHLVEREGKLLARLSHPGVVRIQDTGRDDEHRYIIMDLVAGVALDDVIDRLRQVRERERRPLTAGDVLAMVGPAPAGRSAVLAGAEGWPAAATRLIVELLRTLEAAHGVGVVHRDLKPANVRITGGGFPVLLDFGISLASGMAPGRMTAAMFGTAQYAAPEQWAAGELPGVHTDVYQTGLVLYELLTLHRCFPSESPIETMRAVRDARYPRPRALDAAIDRGLEACVLRAMEVDPARRYKSAAEFRLDLERFLAGEVPLAAAGTARIAQRVRAFGRRHRGAVSLAVAAVVGALGLWLVRGEEVVAWNRSPELTVNIDKAAAMVAFQVAPDASGVLHCAPVRLGTGADATSPGMFARLPAGASRVALHPVGDASSYGAPELRPIFADADDAAGSRRIEALVAALDQARRLIEQRNGDWLSQEEFGALFGPGRGGADAKVSADQLFGSGWQSDGLRGFVLKQPPK